MKPTAQQQFKTIVESIEDYGKENLEEILHKLIEGVQLLSSSDRCRVYLEDLGLGALVCAAAAGSDIDKIRQISFPINKSDVLISQVYQQKQELAIDNLPEPLDNLPSVLAEHKISASYLMPIMHMRRAIGVLCLDRTIPGTFPAEQDLEKVRELLAKTTPNLDRARK